MVNSILRNCEAVVPYIGTWIETIIDAVITEYQLVVPYIGTWIETRPLRCFYL